MKSDTYTPHQVGEAIAKANQNPKKDKYLRHVHKGGREDYQNHSQNAEINSRHDYRDHVIKTLEAEDTQCFHADTIDCDMYYNEGTNTFICVGRNDLSKDTTCFWPDEKYEYFEGQHRKEIKERGGDIERSAIKEGGHKKLYPEQYMEQNKQINKDQVNSSTAKQNQEVESSGQIKNDQKQETFEEKYKKAKAVRQEKHASPEETTIDNEKSDLSKEKAKDQTVEKGVDKSNDKDDPNME